MRKRLQGPAWERGGDGGGGGDDGGEERLKKLAFERDSAKAEVARLAKEIKDLKAALPSDNDRKAFATFLEKRAEIEEIDRKRREKELLDKGEHEAALREAETRHQQELKRLREEAAAKEKQLDDQLQAAKQQRSVDQIKASFYAATTWFGPEAKTVLPPEIAFAAYREYCSFDELDDGTGGKIEQVVVRRRPGGEIIYGANGAPMPFHEAIGHVIEARPDRDYLLRGSSRAGSGSPGGSGRPPEDADVPELAARAAKGDPAAIAALKARSRQAGGIQMGPGFDRHGPPQPAR